MPGSSGRLTPLVRAALACPSCRTSLQIQETGASCTGCARQYPGKGGQLDLRPTDASSMRISVSYDLSRPLPALASQPFAILRADPDSQQDPADVPTDARLSYGNRLTPEIFSYFPVAGPDGGVVVDLGSGEGVMDGPARRTRLDYVSLDLDDDASDILGDAHRLPFADSSVDLVLAFAVLEHLRYPQVALLEVARVLRPGGRFIGSVAFMEPFHLDSFYHHSCLATWDVLDGAGLHVRIVAPSVEWAGVRPIAEMSMFPGLPRIVGRILAWPLDVIHRAWWRVRRPQRPAGRGELARLLEVTGGFRFVADKPVVAGGSLGDATAGSVGGAQADRND